MESQKEYFAFISYKREDERWAKWLQHKLEHYHLPTNVRKENPALPQSIRPVFKDTSELAAGVLADEINEALDNSKYLIVICSPRAAQSKWVGKEVQAFIDMGRSDKIIPFIIGGKPFSENPEEECFPSALLNLPKKQELLGVNINEMGRNAAVVKVVARMFGLKFDTLWQRYEREQKRKRWMWIAGSILLALLGLSIGGYFVRQNGIIERQNERLQQDSITMANHLIQISAQNDSITSQNNLISKQRDSIEHSIQQLQLSNKLLAEERDNVIKANWQTKENYARVVAKEASRLCVEGNAYGAIGMLLNVIPNMDNHYNYPIISEVEASFRQANDSILYSKGSVGIIRKHHRAQVMSVSISKSGKLVTGYNTREACVWNLFTGQEYKELNIQLNSRCTNTLISADGNTIFAGCNSELKAKACDSAGKISETTITDKFDGLAHNVLQMSSDSEYIVYKDLDGNYRFVYVNSLKEFWIIEDLRQLVLSHDSKYAISLSNDKIVSIWNIKHKRKISSFKVECNIYWADISISSDGNYLKIEESQKTTIWNMAMGCKENYGVSCLFSEGTNNVPVLGSLGMGKTIEDSTFRVHAYENGNISIYKKNVKKHIVKVNTYPTNLLFFNHSFSNTTPCYYNEIDSALVIDGQEVKIPYKRYDKDVFLSYRPIYDIDETLNLVAICYPRSTDVYIWNMKKKKSVGRLPHNSTIHEVSFTCNSKYIITQTEDGYSHFWNMENNNEDYSIRTEYNRNINLSYDNRYAYNLGSTVNIWDVRTGKQITTNIQIESDNPSSIYLDSQNTHFITSDNNFIQLWDFRTGTELWRYCLNNPDDVNNKYFVNFCEGGIRILNKKYGKPPQLFFMEFDKFNVLVDKYRRLYNRL